MKSTTELKKGRNVVAIARRCHECKEEALGRCPDCHRGFCQDHFPKQQHSPCAEIQMKLAQTQVSFVSRHRENAVAWESDPGRSRDDNLDSVQGPLPCIRDSGVLSPQHCALFLIR